MSEPSYPDEPILVSQSSVKLIRNTRGTNFEVKVVEGADVVELDRIRLLAVAQAHALEVEFPDAS